MNIKLEINCFFPEPSGIYNLEGLEPNTHYHVRSLSRNKAGLSDASNIIYLHTHSLNAYPRLGSISCSESSGSSERTLLTLLAALSLCRSTSDSEDFYPTAHGEG